jgi:hypothetical protein
MPAAPVPLVVDEKPPEQLLPAFEQRLEGIQEERLSETAGLGQEEAPADGCQTMDLGGLVHIDHVIFQNCGQCTDYKFTLDELAEKSGSAKSQLSEMENNKRPIGLKSARKLAAARNHNFHRVLVDQARKGYQLPFQTPLPGPAHRSDSGGGSHILPLPPGLLTEKVADILRTVKNFSTSPKSRSTLTELTSDGLRLIKRLPRHPALCDSVQKALRKMDNVVSRE